MKFFIHTILLLGATFTSVVGQDKDLEIRFYKQRDKIKKNKIEQITESRFLPTSIFFTPPVSQHKIPQVPSPNPQ